MYDTICNDFVTFGLDKYMNEDMKKKHKRAAEKQPGLWAKWRQNLKDWIWWFGEHPHWYDINIQAGFVRLFVAPVRRTKKHIKELIRARREHRVPETESRIGQLILFLWGSMPRVGCFFSERVLRRRKRSIHTGGKRRSFFEHMHMHPAVFLASALSVAAVAVLLSLYTLGVTALYDGEELGTVSSNTAAKLAVSQVEEITRETLSNTDYAVDPELLQFSTSVVPRSRIGTSETLGDALSDHLGLVEYGYALYVDDQLIAATTFSGALEEMLGQLQIGYRTPNTVECDFVEKVEIREGYVDKSYMMNLGLIAEKLYATKAGAVEYTVVSGDSLYGIAMAHDLSVDDLLDMNPGYSSKGLHPGDVLTLSNAVPYLTVTNIERQTYVQDVPYDIIYQDDDTMYQGDYKVLSAGVYGKADITANVTYVNGMESSRQVVASVTLVEPTTEIQARGTIPRPSWFPNGYFIWPCSGIITDYFGYRNTGISGASSYHRALDIARSYGTPIYASDGGTVVHSGWYGSLGYCVIIDHGNGYRTTYGHNSELYVSVGDHVYQGECIAAMGSSGVSSGPHCHFGIEYYGTWVDPLNYLS